MTNKERQKSLDKQKWLDSEQVGEDMSGAMVYCEFCKLQAVNATKDNWTCTATQEERANECLCAKAYNRMARGK